MSFTVALVGAGPTSIFCLQRLLGSARPPMSVTIFERQRRAGQGTPYSVNWSDPIMLANIASIEIPPLPQSLVDWLDSQTDQRLAEFGVVREDIDARGFYPRLVLGEYLSSQFQALVERARALGVAVDICTQTTVRDVLVVDEAIQLTAVSSRNEKTRRLFDYAILATGHEWPLDPEIRNGYFTSPWPASALSRIHNCAVGMRGTSLSAIDASMALASHHGDFIQIDGQELVYRADPGTENFSITMFSRKGILPEADFYHPIPYEPLVICNDETMQRLVTESHPEELLDAAFELFRQELMLADADYATALSLPEQTLEGFCEAYFDNRAHADPFEWARNNLNDAMRNTEQHFTVRWRYAILRMHEVFSTLVPHLPDRDFQRFTDTLKAVFVDNYATVPHDSIRRLLALHQAGKLSVEQLHDGARVDTRSTHQGATLIDGRNRTHFAAFVEATGQQVSSAKDFPFPSLRQQGVIQDLKSDGDSKVNRGIAIDGVYHPISACVPSDRLFCLSLPFILGKHPFAQGITSSAEMAQVVVDAIQSVESLNTKRQALCAAARRNADRERMPV